jgi:hypothetical protein
MLRMGVFAAALLWCAVSAAAIEGPGKTQFIRAARTSGPVTVDGKLEEDAWARAPAFDAFVQRFPEAGKAPSERTELRVLHDDRNVYFAVTCYDSQPALINRNLGRRDSALFTDVVRLLLDTTHDHRTAYAFAVSAGGVQSDGLYYDDRMYSSDWDGVWDGAAGLREDGWVAEFSIPLSLLRFPEVPMQTWGFSVRREIARKNEELETVDNPRTSGAVVSRLGHLTGLEALKPRRAVELVPYLAARSVARPQYSDAARPRPRLMDPSLDVGLDLKASLTSDLALTATFNPDFGQVEADRLLLNLSTFESFFPEKRPFFTQGMELFQPVGSGLSSTPQTLFYSRRIGLQTPILGAAKLTGTLAEGVEVGVLDAVVTGPWQQNLDEERPDRRLRLHLNRPLHLGPDDALPTEPAVPMNHLAAVVRGKVGAGSRVGGTVTAATPLTGTCTPEQAELDSPPAACLARGGNAAALDFDVRTESGAYGLVGQVDGSQVVGGPPERTLRDGTVLRRGDEGFGGYLRAGKFGGEGFRWDAAYTFASPRLDLNPSGFQRTQNEHAAGGGLRYQRANGLGPLKAFFANLNFGSQWTADGRELLRGSWVNANVSAQLPSFDFVGLEVGGESGGWDVRELDGTGVPLENPQSAFLALFGDMNPNRVVSAWGFAAVARRFTAGPVPAGWAWQGEVGSSFRPHPALETRLEVGWDHQPFGPRFVEELGENHFLLSPLTSNSLSLTLRQQWVLTPRLTLQGYAQLFTAYGTYGRPFEGLSDAARTPVRFSSLVPLEGESPEGFRDVGLNLNLVLRWEYRLGSTLYVVYSRGQQGLPTPEGQPVARTLLPKGLLDGPANDALLVKWAWYLGA